MMVRVLDGGPLEVLVGQSIEEDSSPVVLVTVGGEILNSNPAVDPDREDLVIDFGGADAVTLVLTKDQCSDLAGLLFRAVMKAGGTP